MKIYSLGHVSHKIYCFFYRKHTLLTVLLYSFSIIGCKDKGEPIQVAAEEKNYWSQSTCKIDGKAWGDCYPSFIKRSRVSAVWYKNAIGHPLRLYFFNACDSPFTEINIYLNEFNGVGSYTVSIDNYSEYNIVNYLTRVQYRTNMTKTGTVTITQFDTSIGIDIGQASGTYEFKAFNSDSSQTKAITNGVFDKVRFSTL